MGHISAHSCAVLLLTGVMISAALQLPRIAQAESLESADSTVVVGPVNFELDVLPVLTAMGCNSGACHGKLRGQNGFQLSLLGFDPQFDFAAIAKQSHGRRVFPAAPENSLLLRKASLRVPHGGGERLRTGSPEYEVVRGWIATGMEHELATAPA